MKYAIFVNEDFELFRELSYKFNKATGTGSSISNEAMDLALSGPGLQLVIISRQHGCRTGYS